MANTILTALYSYIDKPKPDFTTVTRRMSRRVSKVDNRRTKTRGFALSDEHYRQIRTRMATWAHDDTVYNIHHKYARQRLYHAMTLAYLTRARPGTELTAIRLNDLEFKNYGSVSTYRIETTGKIGSRTLLMDASTNQVAFFKLWVDNLDKNFPGLGFDGDNPYLFAGSTKTKVVASKRLNTVRLNQLFKSFLRMPGNEDIRFHPAQVTGRDDDNSLEVVFYDTRIKSYPNGASMWCHRRHNGILLYLS